jgi:hypothetical protein
MLSRPRPILLALSLTVLAGCAADEATTGPSRLLAESSVNLALLPGVELPLPAGKDYAWALDIANNGDVVGVSGNISYGWRVGYYFNAASGTASALAIPYAPTGWTGDTDAVAVYGGTVALNSTQAVTSWRRPYRWTSAGGYVPVVLPPLAVHGELSGIGAGGVVGGWVTRGDNVPKAFKSLLDGTYTLLKSPGADSSKVLSVASNGDMAGWAAFAGQMRAVAWIGGTTYVRVPTTGAQHGYATGINNKGEVVGSEYGDPAHPTGTNFRWAPVTGKFAVLNISGSPSDISNKGRIAGNDLTGGFSWFKGVKQSMGVGRATAVNVCGDQVGYANPAPFGFARPMLWKNQPCDP